MDQLEKLSQFFKAIDRDPRIGVSHISVYCVLLHLAVNDSDSVQFRSNEIMQSAKISGLGTYHRCIKDLHELGYFHYIPSYNNREKNRVYF